MQKITQEEFDKINFTRSGVHFGGNLVINEVRKMEVGEILKVNKEDWKPKTSPGICVAGTFRSAKKFSVKALADKSGWVIIRIK